MVSVFFINDLAMIIKYLKTDFESALRAKRIIDGEIINSPISINYRNSDNWSNGVLDKLHDYQR